MAIVQEPVFTLPVGVEQRSGRSIKYRGDPIEVCETCLDFLRRDGFGREETAEPINGLTDLLNTIPDPGKTDRERRESQQNALRRIMKERNQV